MMEIPEWSSYGIRDFIPFTQEVYLHLLKRGNETYWPLHLPMLLVALIILRFAWNKNAPATLRWLCLVWFWFSYGFFYKLYAELNWAGDWFGVICLIQAMILFATSFAVRPKVNRLRWIGLAICVIALFWPLLCPLGREQWNQLEWFGIHADPSMVFTLGVFYILFSGKTLILLSFIPILGIMLSMATLWALELGQYWVLASLILFPVLVRGIGTYIIKPPSTGNA